MPPKKIQQMQCGKQLQLASAADGKYLTKEACPAEHPADMAVGDLMEECLKCEVHLSPEDLQENIITIGTDDPTPDPPGDPVPEPPTEAVPEPSMDFSMETKAPETGEVKEKEEVKEKKVAEEEEPPPPPPPDPEPEPEPEPETKPEPEISDEDKARLDEAAKKKAEQEKAAAATAVAAMDKVERTGDQEAEVPDGKPGDMITPPWEEDAEDPGPTEGAETPAPDESTAAAIDMGDTEMDFSMAVVPPVEAATDKDAPEVADVDDSPTVKPPPAVLEDVPVEEPAVMETPKFSMDDLLPQQETALDIFKILEAVPGYIGGPSKGGISSHIMADCQTCWYKAYLKHIVGLRPIKTGKHYGLGSLIHDALARRYQYGNEGMWNGVEAVAQAGASEMALDARRVVQGMVDRYAVEEYKTLCTRAVEPSMNFWLPQQRVNGKLIRIPCSMRPDMIAGEKQPGDPWPIEGPMENGVALWDHKHSRSRTRSNTEGFARELQFLFGACGYHEGGYVDIYGPLRGYFLNLMILHRKITDNSYFRGAIPLSRRSMHRFYTQELIPVATELYRRLTDASFQDGSKWRQRSIGCVTGWNTLCDFFEICDDGSEGDRFNFVQDDNKILHPDKFMQWSDKKSPPGSVILTEKEIADLAGKKKVNTRMSDEEKSAKKARRKGWADAILSVWGNWLLQVADTHPSMVHLQRGNFLVEGHTRKGVEAHLATQIMQTYVNENGKQVKLQVQEEEITFTYTDKGIKCKVHGFTITSSWKQLSAWICQESWFNPKNV